MSSIFLRGRDSINIDLMICQNILMVCMFLGSAVPDLSGAAGYRSRCVRVFRFWRPASVPGQELIEGHPELLYMESRCSLIQCQGARKGFS